MAAGAPRQRAFFLWVHLFEPHAPYGNPPIRPRRDVRRPSAYDDEIAEADRQAGRLIDAASRRRRAARWSSSPRDHGEAFGEHGEVSHSIFTYDTTLRVPLIVAGPQVPARVVEEPVSLVDVAPTIASLAGLGRFDSDGVVLPGLSASASTVASDTNAAVRLRAPPGLDGPRRSTAESFAPLLDFGWSPLRTIRRGGLEVHRGAETGALRPRRTIPARRAISSAAEPARGGGCSRARSTRFRQPTLSAAANGAADREALRAAAGARLRVGPAGAQRAIAPDPEGPARARGAAGAR